MQFFISNPGDVITAFLFAVLTVLTFCKGWRDHIPWKVAQSTMLAVLVVYYILCAFDANGALFDTGVVRLAVDLFVFFLIAEIIDFGKKK